MTTDSNTSFFMNAQPSPRVQRDRGEHPALCYTWAHPTLRTLTGEAWAWQGVKPMALASELFDMRQFGDFRPFETGDFDDLQLPNAFDVTLTAIMPPAVVPSGRHFDQAMRTEGTLLLRGRPHTVDGYTVRDRS